MAAAPGGNSGLVYYGYEGSERLKRMSVCWYCKSAEYLSVFQSKSVICRNSPPPISRVADPCCVGSPAVAPTKTAKDLEAAAAVAAPAAPAAQIVNLVEDRLIGDGTLYWCSQFQRKTNSPLIPNIPVP